MNVCIRTDSSIAIGTGHFMRCLTLADALKQRGAQIRFISRHLPEHLRDMLTAKDYEFMPLNNGSSIATPNELDHAHWLGTSQHTDAQASIQALSDHIWDWLVVDHYALDAEWESALRQITRNILVIDDLADRQHDCDVLLDQNLYADMDTRYTGKVPAHCRLLLGPRYALLREEFRQLHAQIKLRTGPVKRMLVFFGGVDADNYTGRIVGALANLGIGELHVDVVIGSQHPSREQIESECVQYGFTCHVQTDRMAELMATADLAIGAGGSTIWERCCLGLPTLTICTADNQHKQIVDAASEGLLYAPELNDELVLMVSRHVNALMENGCLRRFISSNGIQAVDGHGVLRVAGNLGCSGIEIRTARPDDLQKLFEWRNHPTVRAASRNPEAINWEDHQKWFAAVLISPDSLLLIGRREGTPVGVVRFDIQDDEAEVSIYLVPDIKESGLGRDLLQSAEHWFLVNRPKVCTVRAHVLGGNERSQRLFLGMGYQAESTCYLKKLH